MDVDLVTTKKAAEILKVAQRTLEKWRLNKMVKLPYIKIGGAVKYHRKDIIKLIDDNTIRN